MGMFKLSWTEWNANIFEWQQRELDVDESISLNWVSGNGRYISIGKIIQFIVNNSAAKDKARPEDFVKNMTYIYNLD